MLKSLRRFIPYRSNKPEPLISPGGTAPSWLPELDNLSIPAEFEFLRVPLPVVNRARTPKPAFDITLKVEFASSSTDLHIKKETPARVAVAYASNYQVISDLVTFPEMAKLAIGANLFPDLSRAIKRVGKIAQRRELPNAPAASCHGGQEHGGLFKPLGLPLPIVILESAPASGAKRFDRIMWGAAAAHEFAHSRGGDEYDAFMAYRNYLLRNRIKPVSMEYLVAFTERYYDKKTGQQAREKWERSLIGRGFVSRAMARLRYMAAAYFLG